MSFTYKGSKVHLSITYDGITIFYDNRPIYQKIKNPDNQMGYILAPNPIKSQIESAYPEIQKISGRYVYSKHKDHSLYHVEESEYEAHSHLKFPQQLTRETISTVLSILVNHDVITKLEQAECLDAWDEWMRVAMKSYTLGLTGKKDRDIFRIIQCIRKSEDNHLLVAFQRHLLKKDFDYLRDLTGLPFSFWQGTIDNKGVVAATSYSWAMIEKAISLRMAENIRRHCNFTKKVAAERADQLSAHKFFTIRRFVIPGTEPTNNSSFEAFRDANKPVFDDKYRRHFKAFKRG